MKNYTKERSYCSTCPEEVDEQDTSVKKNIGFIMSTT